MKHKTPRFRIPEPSTARQAIPARASSLRRSQRSTLKIALTVLLVVPFGTELAFAARYPIPFLVAPYAAKGTAGIVTRQDGMLLTASSPTLTGVFDPLAGVWLAPAFVMPPPSSLPDDLVILPPNPALGIVGGFSTVSFLDGRIYTVLNNGTVIQSDLGETAAYTQTGIYGATYIPALQGIDPITYRKSNDRLYTAGFDPNNLYMVDWRGSVPTPIPLLPALPEGRSLNGFAFGPDDQLYAPEGVHDQIVRIDADTGQVTPIVSNVLSPVALKVSSNGTLYFLSRSTGTVYQSASDGSNLKVLATLEPALDNLCISLDETQLYVTNDENEIFKVDIATRATQVLFRAPFTQVWDMKYDLETNSLYVADFASIKQFNVQTRQLMSVIRFGDIDSGLSDLGSQVASISVESGPGAKIVVTDTTIGNVIVLNKADYSIYDKTLTSDQTGLALEQPMSGVHIPATPSRGEYYLVTNTAGGSILKIYHNGPIKPGNIVSEPYITGLNAPEKLLLYNGYLYIVELGQVDQGIPDSGRISRVLLNDPQNVHVLVANLNEPNGLDIVDGKMYFVESGNARILEADATHRSIPIVVEYNLDLEQDIIVSGFNPVAKINPPTHLTIMPDGGDGSVQKRSGPAAITLFFNETRPNIIATYSENIDEP